jgi:hypothetical protein
MRRGKKWIAVGAIAASALTIGACTAAGGSGQSQSYKDGWNYIAQASAGSGGTGIKYSNANANNYACKVEAEGSMQAEGYGDIPGNAPAGDDIQQWIQGCFDANAAGAVNSI